MHVTLLAPAPFATVSGAHAYDRAIAEGLRAAGHAVTLVMLAGAHPLCDEAAFAAARAAWDALAPDTVPVIDGLALPAFAPLAEQLAARGTVGLIHHPTALGPDHDAATQETLRGIERDLLPRLACMVATADSTAERLVTEFGVDRERVAVITPGTSDAPRSVGSGDAGCAILSVGALVPRKGHDGLMRALARLFDLDWRLTIVGSAKRDPACAKSLQALADSLSIAGRVTFAGDLRAAALEEAWLQADLFALASRWESTSMLVAEAFRRGLPVAVSDGTQAATLVTPETGVVVTAGDDVTLSKSLRRLIFDTALRRDMADAAWTRGQTLPDWRAQAEAFAQAITP